MFQINDLEYKTELARAKAAVSNAMAEAKAAELAKYDLLDDNHENLGDQL